MTDAPEGRLAMRYRSTRFRSSDASSSKKEAAFEETQAMSPRGDVPARITCEMLLGHRRPYSMASIPSIECPRTATRSRCAGTVYLSRTSYRGLYTVWRFWRFSISPNLRGRSPA
jgi:hypothetical protein